MWGRRGCGRGGHRSAAGHGSGPPAEDIRIASGDAEQAWGEVHNIVLRVQTADGIDPVPVPTVARALDFDCLHMAAARGHLLAGVTGTT